MTTFDGIINQVAEFYGIKNDDLLGGCRREDICDARHVAMYVCHRLLGMDYKAIGAKFGRGRSIVYHAFNKIADYVDHPRYNRRAAECVETIFFNNNDTKK